MGYPQNRIFKQRACNPHGSGIWLPIKECTNDEELNEIVGNKVYWSLADLKEMSDDVMQRKSRQPSQLQEMQNGFVF
jgi:hypothetical protein